MSEVQRFSLHTGHLQDGEIITEDNASFNLTAFSKFKHGSRREAVNYGNQLVAKLTKEHPEYLIDDVVVTASCSKFLPLASDALADAVCNALNIARAQIGSKPADRAKIHRAEIMEGDYSSFSDEERAAIVARDQLNVPEGLIKDRRILVVDDLRMTGKTEGKIDDYLSHLSALSLLYLYAITMDQESQNDPTLEARMNKAYVNDLVTLSEIIQAEDFMLNSRVSKMIISEIDADKLTAFLSGQTNQFLYDLYTGIVGNGYNHMKSYQPQVGRIEEELTKRGMLKKGVLSL